MTLECVWSVTGVKQLHSGWSEFRIPGILCGVWKIFALQGLGSASEVLQNVTLRCLAFSNTLLRTSRLISWALCFDMTVFSPILNSNQFQLLCPHLSEPAVCLVPLPMPQYGKYLWGRKQSPHLLLPLQILVLYCQFSNVSYISSSFPVASCRRTSLLLFTLDWWRQRYTFLLTLESINPAQPFSKCLASHL